MNAEIHVNFLLHMDYTQIRAAYMSPNVSVLSSELNTWQLSGILSASRKKQNQTYPIV